MNTVFMQNNDPQHAIWHFAKGTFPSHLFCVWALQFVPLCLLKFLQCYLIKDIFENTNCTCCLVVFFELGWLKRVRWTERSCKTQIHGHLKAIWHFAKATTFHPFHFVFDLSVKCQSMEIMSDNSQNWLANASAPDNYWQSRDTIKKYNVLHPKMSGVI